MKTEVMRLQGQDIIMTELARRVVFTYLKKLQATTRFRSRLYKQYVEALRDVLTSDSKKTVSVATAQRAVEVVGLPDATETAGSIVASVVVSVRQFRKKSSAWSPSKVVRNKGVRRFLRAMAVVGVIIALFFGTMSLFSALMSSVSVSTQKSGWVTTDTTIGVVRSWQDAPNPSQTSQWPMGWQVGVVLGVILLVIAYVLVQLLRRGFRLVYGMVLFVCLCLVMGLSLVQRANMAIPPESQIVGSQTPIEPRLAYLQQCGDEIPYVFDGNSSGMLFRSLRDEGYVLATPIKTMESNGSMSIDELCQQYDTLRQTHAKKDVVLQFYTVQADGTPRTYDFSDIGNDDVTSTFGLFVKG